METQTKWDGGEIVKDAEELEEMVESDEDMLPSLRVLTGSHGGRGGGWRAGAGE